MKKFFLLLFLLTPTVSFAYTSLTGIGNIQGNQVPPGNSGLGVFINQIFFIGLIIAIVLAIFMIIRGGYEYMTSSDNSNKKGNAKKRLQAALGGLLLAIGAVLILKTINPNLVNFSIEFPGLEKPGAGQYDSEILAETQLRSVLSDGMQGEDGLYIARSEQNMLVLDRISDEELVATLNDQLETTVGEQQYRDFLTSLYNQRLEYENDVTTSTLTGESTRTDHSLQLTFLDRVITRYESINNQIKPSYRNIFSQEKTNYEKHRAEIEAKNKKPGLEY